MVMRGAFTAKAAFQIHGFTLHSLFELPIESGHRSFVSLKGKQLAQLQRNSNESH